MAVICVNTSSPEFKGLLEKTHFSEGTLKSIIHEYQNTPSLWEKGQGLWPSDDYVMNYFNRRTTGSPAQIAVWNGRFSAPHIYADAKDALAAKQEATKWFNEESISVYQNQAGNWVMTVSRPLDIRTIKKNSDVWLQDLQRDINATVNTGAYGRYIPRKNEPFKNVPAIDYLGKRLDNFYRQRGLKVQAYWSKNSQKWMVRYSPEEKGYVDDITGGITDWTEGQKNAIEVISAWLNDASAGKFMLLEGPAGSGKTSIINEILTKVRPRQRVLIGALSHQAKGVLSSKLSKQTRTNFFVEAKSLAGMFGMKQTTKMVDGEWIELFEPDKYSRRAGIPIQGADIVIIDEASMVSEEHMYYIEDLMAHGTKVLFIGDQRQLPPIRTKGSEFYKKHPELVGSEADSPVFTRTDIPRVSLTERVRQGEDSPIHAVTDQFGNYTLQGGQFPTLEGVQSSKDLRLVVETGTADLVQQMVPLFQEGVKTMNPNYAKIVASTNVKGRGNIYQYNKAVHFALHPEMIASNDMNFAVGELVTLYNNYKQGDAYIAYNSENGIVKEISGTYTMTTSTGHEIRYRSYTIKFHDGREETMPVLEQDAENINNFNKALAQLKQKAQNEGGGAAWRPFYNLKESMADLHFGYASTVHKSQGSTYQVVGVDTTDSFGSARLKSQALYTAMTRAANITIVKGMGSQNVAPSPEAIAAANQEVINKKTGNTASLLTPEQLAFAESEAEGVAKIIKDAAITISRINLRKASTVTVKGVNDFKDGDVSTASAVCKSIINSPNATEQQKALAKALLPLLAKMDFDILFANEDNDIIQQRLKRDNKESWNAAGTTFSSKAAGMGYDIHINIGIKKNKVMPEKVLLHEIVHALTTNRLRNDAEFRRGIDNIVQYVMEYVRTNKGSKHPNSQTYNDVTIPFDIYAFRNYNDSGYADFVTKAMSNAEFQELLKQIPAPDESQLSTWQKLCKAVAEAFRSLFNTSYRQDTSVYDMLIPVIADTMTLTSEQDERSAAYNAWNLDRTAQMMANADAIVKAMNVTVEDKDVHWTTEQVMQLFGESASTEPTELTKIKEEAIANGTFMKAPNGNPTNLTEQQWLQVRTKAFKDWFGDWENDPANASKVVDENGEPLVVYHGTREIFDEFNYDHFGSSISADLGKGFYFSSSYRKAQEYAGLITNEGFEPDKNGRVISAFLNLRNPGNTKEHIEDSWNGGKTTGIDGIMFKDFLNELTVFNPNQIKSAIKFSNNKLTNVRGMDFYIPEAAYYSGKAAALYNYLGGSYGSSFDGLKYAQQIKDIAAQIQNTTSAEEAKDLFNSILKAPNQDIQDYVNAFMSGKYEGTWTQKREEETWRQIENQQSAQSKQDEIESIKQRAIANGTFMKAPNGKDTNLTEQQWLYVRTKEFKDWFGDWENDPANASKVVDENGEPLVMYHGTNNDRFSIFDLSRTGEYQGEISKRFGNAAFFAEPRDTRHNYKKMKNVIYAFLNIRKPFETGWWESAGRQKELFNYYKEDNPETDGVVLINGEEDEPWKFDEAVIFNNDQVKIVSNDVQADAYSGVIDNTFILKEFIDEEMPPEADHVYNIMYNGEQIGIVALTDTGENNIIRGINFDERFRGKGLGKKLYKWLNMQAAKRGGVLFSDFDNTSESAKRVWDSLKKEGIAKDTSSGMQYKMMPYKNQQSIQASPSTGGNKTVVKKGDTVKITMLNGVVVDAKIADIQPRINGFSLLYISPVDGLTRVIESDINGNPVDFSAKHYGTVTTTDGNPIELFPTPKTEPTQEELFKTALKDTVERINYLEGQIGWVDSRIKYNQATSSDYTWKQECEEKLAKEQQLLEAARAGKAEVYTNENGVPFLREKLEKPVEKNIVVDDAYELTPVETKKEGYTQGVIIRKKNMRATAKQGADQVQRMIEQGKLALGTHVMWQGLNTSELAALNRVNGLNKNEDGSWTVGYNEREMNLRKQNDTLLNNTMFGNHELHKLAALTMFKLSETITQLQDGSVKIEDILMDESLTDEIRGRDFKGMDRIEIINAIGLDKLFKDYIREKVFNADINENLQEDFDLADKAQVIYDNFDAFIRLGYQDLIDLENISVDTERAINTETDKKKDEQGEDLTDEEVVALFGSTVEHWQVGFRQVSTFSSLSKLMRQYLNRIYVLDKEGNRVTDEYGIERNIDAHEAVSKILKWTQGATDIDDMISKLERKVAQEPWVQQLIDLLNTDGNEQLRSQFFSNFKKYFQKYNIIYKEKQKDGSTKTRVKTINRDPFVISTLDMLTSLDNSKEMGSFNLWDARKNSIDSNAIKAIGFGVTSLEALLNYKKGGMKLEGDVWNRHIEFIERALNALNIPMPSRELLIQTLDSPNVLSSMYTAVKGLYDTFSRVPTGDASYKFVNNKTQSNYTRIIEAFAPVMGDGLDSVSYEAGKLHYSYVTPSYLSKFVENMKGMRGDVRAFIESEYGNIEGWFRNKRNNANQDGGQGWLNYWLDRMMSDIEEAKNTREKFDHIVVLSDNGTAYAAKSPVQYMASMFSMYLYDDHGASAYYRIPMMSNKPSEEYIKFDRIKNGYRDVITDWLVEKTFAQEINRIRAVNFRNNAPAELEKLRAKKNLSAEEQARKTELEEIFKDGMPTKISSFDKNGAKFMFMEYLNQYVEDSNSELGALLRKKINGEKFDPATNESSRFTELLREAVQSNIDAAFNRFLRNLALEGLIQLSPDMNVIKVNAIQDKLPLGQAKDRLEEFFWNDMFASINLMQLLCIDIAYYKNTEDLQKRFAQWHSPGLRGDVNATIGGQKVTDGNTRSMYIADRIETSDIVETLKKVKEKVLAQDRFRNNAPAKALMAAQFDKVIDAFKEVNVTDAQAYTSPTGYRKKMAVFGQWTPRDEEVYQRILSGDFTAEDLDVMWQPLKPFVYSQIEKRGFNPYMPTLKMGVQQKNSEYCIILADALMRSAGVDSKLTAIFDFMEESHKQNPMKGIDTIMFNSAVKTGLMGTLDINDHNLSHDAVVNYLKDMSGMNQGEYDDRYVHTIPFEDYSIQQYNPAHFEGEQQMGSQNRVLVFADMPNVIDGVEQFIEVDGKKVSVKNAKIAYFKAIIDNIRRSGEAVKQEFDLGNKSKKMKNLAMMRALQREIVKDSRYGTDLQWACMLDDNGEFNIPLSDAIQSDRIQQLLNSIIKNRINKQEIAGGPVVQVSNYGTSEDLKIVRNADGTIKYFECYVTAYDPQLYEDFGDGKGGIDMEKIEKANPKLLEMIGYRIPTEAKYSMAPLKIKGFLPKTGGEGIMLPKEITTLSGSDFDVDKMYIMRYQLDRTDNRNQVIKEIEDEYKAAGKNGIASRVKPLINGEMQPRDAADYLILSSWRSKHKIEWNNPTSGKYANDNLIIATQWGILTSGMAEDQVLSSGNFDEVKRIGYMMAAMDNGTEYDVASKMTVGSLKNAAYTNKYLQYADTQMQFHKQNMIAAKLIGVFAQANVSHAIVGMSDIPAEIQIPEGGAMTINGQSYFESHRYIVDQEYGLDNATRISSLLAQFLASSVDAVKDPVLNLLNINMDTVNVAVTLARLGHDLEFIGLFLTHPIIKQLVSRYNVEAASGSTNNLMQTLNAMQKEIKGEDGKGASLQMQYNYDKGFFVREHNRSDRQDEAYLQYRKDMDLTVLELYKKLNNMAEMFRGVIHTTRYNSITSAVGPYASDTMDNRLKDESFESNSYVTDELRKAAEGIIYDENGREISLIQAFRDTSSELERELLGDNMIQASEETYKVYKALKSKMGYMSSKMAKEFGRFYMSYYMNMETPLFDLSDGHREEMIDRFPKQFMSKKNQYRDNTFVQAIMMDKDKAGNDILTINTRGLTDSEIQALRSDWADLYTSEREKGIADADNLALKLVEYNFFLGSFGFSPKTFMSMTPNNVKLAIPGYKESLLKQLDMNQDRIDNLVIQFMLNMGYANLGTLKEKEVTFQSGDLIASREFDREPQSVGLAKMQMNDGTTRWIYAEPINNSNDVRVYFVDKLGGENQQCFEIDPSRKVYEIQSIVKNSEPESATEAQPDGGQSTAPMVDDGRTVYQHLMPLLAAVRGGYVMDNPKLNMQNLQDRFNKLYNAGQQSFISSATGLNMDVIDKVAEVMGVTQEELLSDVQESENKLNLCK